MSTCLLFYYRYILTFTLCQLSTSITLIMLLLIFATYYIEKRVKLEFIQLRYNQRLNYEMCQVIENIPEGIIIYNNEKKDIVMANQESRRLFKAYNVEGCTPGPSSCGSGPPGQTTDHEMPFFDLTASQ
jgi:sensor histidine kinase regulating citrate/malate metabolism